MRLLVLSLVLALAACSEKSDIAEQVEERADNRADAMEAAGPQGDNALQQNIVEQQARTVREAGEERAKAIRESDLDADTLSNAQQNALVQGK